MQCPACYNQLSPFQVGNVTVDVCQGGCGGIWFDAFELQRVDDQAEAAGEAMLTPVMVAAVRRYATTAQRSIAFAIFYAMMNTGFAGESRKSRAHNGEP